MPILLEHTIVARKPLHTFRHHALAGFAGTRDALLDTRWRRGGRGFFGGTPGGIMNLMSPDSTVNKQPALVEVPRFRRSPAPRVVIAPAAIALHGDPAMRLDAAAPRNLAGQEGQQSVSKSFCSNADIGL